MIIGCRVVYVKITPVKKAENMHPSTLYAALKKHEVLEYYALFCRFPALKIPGLNYAKDRPPRLSSFNTGNSLLCQRTANACRLE